VRIAASAAAHGVDVYSAGHKAQNSGAPVKPTTRHVHFLGPPTRQMRNLCSSFFLRFREEYQDGQYTKDNKKAGERMYKIDMQLRGYRLTTAEILYHMPDHPKVLQSFLWQELDLAPKFPVLNKFLRFWEDNIEGKLHSVRVAARGLISPAELKSVGAEFTMH
jgi:uncharacterized protein Usg